jgi:hypothetical protein
MSIFTREPADTRQDMHEAQALDDQNKQPQQLKCKAGCGKALHYFSHYGPRGPVYTCSRCGAEQTK